METLKKIIETLLWILAAGVFIALVGLIAEIIGAKKDPPVDESNGDYDRDKMDYKNFGSE